MDSEDLPQIDIANIEKTAKRGFDLAARLKGRGLRKSTITLYLDDEVGAELGFAADLRNKLGELVGRHREGVVGELDRLTDLRERIQAAYDEALKARETFAETVAATPGGDANLVPEVETPDFAETDAKIAELTAKREELMDKLKGTGLIVKMTAVPNVIQKDLRRKAKQTLKIEEKGIPEDRQDEFKLAYQAHLMCVMFNSITDVESGEVNTEVNYDDAISLIDYLPQSQYNRLDLEMGRVQFTDAISQSIENQEDFS